MMARIYWLLVHILGAPIAFLAGFGTLYAYVKEGDHMFSNNSAAHLTELVIGHHLVELNLLKQAMLSGDEEVLGRAMESDGVRPGWPQNIGEMKVPFLYWLTLWPVYGVSHRVGEYTRIRVQERVRLFLEDEGRKSV